MAVGSRLHLTAESLVRESGAEAVAVCRSSSRMLERYSLDDCVVIVTGGAGLLGREYCAALAEAGAHVVVADTDREGARVLAAALGESSGREHLGVATDVSDRESVRAMVGATLSAFSRIDGLVNNAGLDPKFEKSRFDENAGAFEDFPLELWNRSLAVNITGMFLCAQAVAPSMLAARRGSIVNIASTYGVVGPDQRLYESTGNAPRSYKPVSYSVTKSAAIGLTRYLATYWGDRGIRVNTLTPGGVLNEHDEEFVRRYSARTPLGRMADRSEYSCAVVFLLSDASSYMTGANLVMDGGWTAW